MRATSKPGPSAPCAAADAAVAARRQALPGYALIAHEYFGATLIREPGDDPPGAVPDSAGRARPDDRCDPGARVPRRIGGPIQGYAGQPPPAGERRRGACMIPRRNPPARRTRLWRPPLPPPVA